MGESVWARSGVAATSTCRLRPDADGFGPDPEIRSGRERIRAVEAGDTLANDARGPPGPRNGERPGAPERLEVDPRTVRRYAVTLEELGIPLETERGPYGGYRLRPGFKLPPLMLTTKRRPWCLD
jgi:HTH domain